MANAFRKPIGPSAYSVSRRNCERTENKNGKEDGRRMEGEEEEKKKDRWCVGQRDEERKRVRRRIWNDGREGQGAKERDGRRKSEEGNGIGTGH